MADKANTFKTVWLQVRAMVNNRDIERKRERERGDFE